ncbi:DUF3344 domain-containing protein [Methanofollis formosanus]|nr:DUF3344 domain-containing protein [Methanofollis formosanus]
MYYARHHQIVLCILLSLILIGPSSALYDFEGVPFDVTAQGEVQGDVRTFGTYGLAIPPVECSFSLNHTPRYARAYCGVWGGNERYTGWVEMTVNDHPPVRVSLGGVDDAGDAALISGHGVAWEGWDLTGLLRPGENTVTVTTSRGETGNRLDGRVYALQVVAVEEDPARPLTRYWIAEGNENLHGEGWAGDLQTRKDETSISFGGVKEQVAGARLTLLLLATQKGQPDYATFNGHDLGSVAGGEYLPGARDIGDERSFNADGGEGTRSRYVDAETFDVTDLAGETNTLTIARGRDLDGDGSISSTGATPEGEDYLHPVLAVLAVQPAATSPAPDLSLGDLAVSGAYTGRTADLQAVLRNAGSLPGAPVTVRWTVDGAVIAEETVVPAARGVQTVHATWDAVEGRHEIAAVVSAAGDRGTGDNGVARSVTVGALPDLAVDIDEPYRADGAGPAPTSSPLPFPLAAWALGVAALAAGRKSRGTCLLVLLLVAAVTVVPAGAAGAYEQYEVPVEVKNLGGSDAAPFQVTVYLDGEKVAALSLEAGLAAGGTEHLKVPLSTTPGDHTLRVVADENGVIEESDTNNNAAEGRYAFP